MKQAIQEWYSTEVLYEIVKCLQGKECVFLGSDIAVRGIKAHKVDFLRQNMDAFRFFSREMNIYFSLADYQGLPMLSFNPTVRAIQYKKYLEGEMFYRVGHSIAMDFDAHDTGFETAFEDFKRVKLLFDKHKVPYSPRFSGSGFHIHIPFECYPSGEDWKKLAGLFLREMDSLMDLSSLDTSTQGLRSVLKVPYSLDVKTGNVCLPLTDAQIDKFSLSDMNWKSVKGSISIRNRGTLLREGTPETFKSFLEAYIK